jgi:endonuclease/exonuclease/phosphatase family metal-dependent hydrolase
VLVRGAEISAVRAWPDDERRYDGKLLSDHAPVEVDLKVDIGLKQS